MQALGLIEVKGMLSAIVVADNALKAANVELVDIKKVSGGLVTVLLKGDVGAIQAAVDSAAYGIADSSLLLSTHVIPRPAFDVEELINDTKPEVETPKPAKQNTNDNKKTNNTGTTK